jgi:uncharacterized protein with FMN-binding domain
MVKLKSLLSIIIMVLVFSISGCMNVDGIIIKDIDLLDVEDRQYTGEYSMGPVKVVVLVLVQNHIIKGIEITKHRNGKGAGAEKITEDVIRKQSLQVDVVTGATASSKIILKAIENALKTD